MKLAELLALRKDLNAKLARLTFDRLSLPAQQVKSVNVPQMDALDKTLSDIAYKPVLAVMGERHHVSKRLALIDGYVQAANAGTILSIPSTVGTDFLTQHSSATKEVMLFEALLLRKHAKAMVETLTFLTNNALKENRIERQTIPGANPNGLDRVSITTNSFLLSEATQALGFWQKSLRCLDTAIQERNWTVDINVSLGVTQEYDPQSYLTPQVVSGPTFPPSSVPPLTPA